MVAGLNAGFVVAEALFHVRNDGAQGFQRECVEFVEADIQQGFDQYRRVRERQLDEFSLNLVIVFIYAENLSDFVENFRLTAEGCTRKLFPLVV